MISNLQLTDSKATLNKVLPGSVIIVIGESANRDHMKAFNKSYTAETTPWLSKASKDDGFYLYPKAYANFPVTSKSLSMYLTNINQYNNKDPVKVVTITDLANKAGYQTFWISNQEPGTRVLSLLANASTQNLWINPPMGDDKNVVEQLKKIPRTGSQFIVIHLEGSHDRYNARYPSDYPQFYGNDKKIVDEYDTSIRYTDDVLKDIFEYASENMNLQVMTYCSDHGEDMEYFHTGSKFTFDMVRVPLFIYLSPEYREIYPEIATTLEKHEGCIFTNDLMYDTISGLIRAANSEYDAKYDLASTQYDLSETNAVSKHGQKKIRDDPQLN